MEKLEDYKEAIELAVKGGFRNIDDINKGFMELGLPEDETKEYINNSFYRHNEENSTSEDVLKLQRFFDELCSEGYMALHRAGYTSSDVFDTIDMVLEETNFKPFGYLAYHEQDLNRVIASGTFTLSFGAFRDTEQTQSSGMSKQETGAHIKERFEALGFSVNWDGDPGRKLELVDFNYAKVYDDEDWSYDRCLDIFENLG